MRILGQPPVAHLHEAEDALDDAEGMLDPGAYLRLGSVLRPLNLIDRILEPIATVGEVLRLRRMRADDLALPVIGRVAPDARLLAMQQVGQPRVVHVGRVATTEWISLVWLSTPMCAFMPKYH